MVSMMVAAAVLLSVVVVGIAAAHGETISEKDVFQTSGGNLEIAFIGHASLMIRFQGRVIHVDPVSEEADYSRLPKADLLLITHDHNDHLSPSAVKSIRRDDTSVVLTEKSAMKIRGGQVMKNGETLSTMGIAIEAVPAYNIANRRPDGKPFHPRGEGNGYILTLGDKRVYIAGDTENTPEMKSLKGIDIAFLPMNLPYTMTPGMVADGALSFRPKVLYPYHYGDTDVDALTELLKNEPAIEVRIRKMK